MEKLKTVRVSEDGNLQENIKTELEAERNKNVRNRDKKELFQMAVEALQSGQFQSTNACAKHFQITYSTLRRVVMEERQYVGSGRKSSVFTPAEESKITKFVNERISLGCDIDFNQLCLIMKELIGALRAADPSRQFPPSFDSDFPNESFARRFVRRNNLLLVKQLPLKNYQTSQTTAVLSAGELQSFINEILGNMKVLKEEEVSLEEVLEEDVREPQSAPLAHRTAIACHSDPLEASVPSGRASSPPDIRTPATDPQPRFVTLRDDSLEERKQNLQKFELVMIKPHQIAEFENLFKRGARFEVPDYLWQSWLPLKLATVSVTERAEISEENPDIRRKRKKPRKV